jgi:hypothetical protein
MAPLVVGGKGGFVRLHESRRMENQFASVEVDTHFPALIPALNPSL